MNTEELLTSKPGWMRSSARMEVRPAPIPPAPTQWSREPALVWETPMKQSRVILRQNSLEASSRRAEQRFGSIPSQCCGESAIILPARRVVRQSSQFGRLLAPLRERKA